MSRAVSPPRESGNAELYAWFFMRVTGLVLLFLAVFHLLYMHLVIGVDGTLYEGRDPAYRGDTGTSYDTTGHFLVVLEGNFEVERPTQGNDHCVATYPTRVESGIVWIALSCFLLLTA